MLYKLWQFIQLLLPFWVILKIYKNKKSIPSNINTKNGRKLKAVLITTDYGVIFSDEQYVSDRLKKLLTKKRAIDNASQQVLNEINELDFFSKEELNRLMKDEQG